MKYDRAFRTEAMDLWGSAKWDFDSFIPNSIDISPRYEEVEIATGVPAPVVAVIHRMESSSGFDTHLHNGDPLEKKTTHVPKGRPRSGTPPFTWTDSAVDALTTRWKDWSVMGCLYFLERYNGWGYRSKGINSPYIWSKTNHHTTGKYTSDGHYDRLAISNQTGAAPLLRDTMISYYTESIPTVPYYLGQKHIQVVTLQELLWDYRDLVCDGWLGRKTAAVFKEIFGVDISPAQ